MSGIELNIPGAFLFLLCGLYFGVIAVAYYALTRLKTGEGSAQPFSSIVIAARNESKRIIPCLKSLENLAYPEDRYEVILVDDASADDTGKTIAAYSEKHRNWHAIVIDEKSVEMPGKTNALAKATEKARGELVFATDADCQVPTEWLTHMVKYFQADVSMVVGYSPIVPGKGCLHHFLQSDNLFSAIHMAVTVKLGFPSSSAGRNLAYRLEALKRAGGYDSIKKFRSGDDTHLTERFRYLQLGRVAFCAHPGTFVQTLPPENLKGWFHQQIRKRSKVFRKTTGSVLLTLLLFSSYASVFAMPFAIPDLPPAGWSVLLCLRYVGEFACLYRAAVQFGQGQLIRFIPVMQILLPLHIIFFTLLGALQGYRWKK